MNPYTIAGLASIGAATAGGIFGWGAMSPSAEMFGRTVRTTGDPRTVALTFDDGPNPAITPGLLDLLDRYHARATFFLIGQHVRAFPALAAEIRARGHAIGNHTETHPNLIFLSRKGIERELTLCQDALAEATGAQAQWMRPPYGFRGPQLSGVLRRLGFHEMAMWSVLAWDWKPQPAEPVIARLRTVRGGDIVLLHDGHHRLPDGDRRHTVAALEFWLPRWQDELRFVTMDECPHRKPAVTGG